MKKNDTRKLLGKKVSKTQLLVYEMKVRDVMKKEVIYVEPETMMSELREIFRANGISGAPVIDDGKLVGIISLEDFIKWLADKEEDKPIAEKMTKDVKTLYANEPLFRVIGKFEELGVGRFPVLERKSKKLVGVITKGNIIEGLLKKLENDYHQEEIKKYRASHIFVDIIADKVSLLFQYEVEGKHFSKAGESASNLKKTLKRLGLSPETIRRVAVATYEAEMNLIVFTNGGSITAYVDPKKVLIEVKDSGPGIADIEKALQPGYSTAPEFVRELGFGAGMGLNNIQRCADKMEIDSKVNEGTYLKILIGTGDNDEVK